MTHRAKWIIAIAIGVCFLMTGSLVLFRSLREFAAKEFDKRQPYGFERDVAVEYQEAIANRLRQQGNHVDEEVRFRILKQGECPAKSDPATCKAWWESHPLSEDELEAIRVLIVKRVQNRLLDEGSRSYVDIRGNAHQYLFIKCFGCGREDTTRMNADMVVGSYLGRPEFLKEVGFQGVVAGTSDSEYIWSYYDVEKQEWKHLYELPW